MTILYHHANSTNIASQQGVSNPLVLVVLANPTKGLLQRQALLHTLILEVSSQKSD